MHLLLELAAAATAGAALATLTTIHWAARHDRRRGATIDLTGVRGIGFSYPEGWTDVTDRCRRPAVDDWFWPTASTEKNPVSWPMRLEADPAHVAGGACGECGRPYGLSHLGSCSGSLTRGGGGIVGMRWAS